MCQNCKLCKSYVVIDSKIATKIKRTLADNITTRYKDELMGNRTPAIFNSTIYSLRTDNVKNPIIPMKKWLKRL